MDYSAKATTTTTVIAEDTGEQGRSSETNTDAALSPVETDNNDETFPCPACPSTFSSSHELSNHLRGHNSPRSTTDYSGEDDYTCGVCHKVLSSASSLDRHVLVHSGERPFKCKHCEMAFTTNGNMNRHLRTAHPNSSPRENSFTDSETSSDSGKSTNKRRHCDNDDEDEEYNNNEITKTTSTTYHESPIFVTKRKCPDSSSIDIVSPKKHKILMTTSSRNDSQNDDNSKSQLSHDCQVCGKLDFPTLALLESHLECNHPQFPAKCEICDQLFKNHRSLNLHRFMAHYSDPTCPTNNRNLRNSVVGFHDLTFVDFSSDKFPAIARAVCEQSLHRPATGEATTFQCGKCLRAFPCRSALDGHEIDCGSINSNPTIYVDDCSRRNDFFARLDLQNKAAMTEAKDGKDLADIQSIISVTSGPILQNFPRSDASTPEHQIKINPNLGSSGSSGTPSSEYHQEEEAQDAFAAEFRKMKLKGEFPCRLCTAVFPNLRALKGHNRAHMGVGPGLPYPCNMCPYTSTDKATLVRHLRSHNGDRPFECSLCNYAFTTKANCERHVRNRHGKLTREDIKSVLIYHPSEDYTNDGSLDRNSSPRCNRDDARKSLIYSNERDEFVNQRSLYSGLTNDNKNDQDNISDDGHNRPVGMQTPRGISSLGHYERTDAVITGTPTRGSQSMNIKNQRFSRNFDRSMDYPNNSDYSGKNYDDVDSRSSEDESVSIVSDAKSDVVHRTIVDDESPMDLKKIPSPTTIVEPPTVVRKIPLLNQVEEAPLDLSMDVLDLSRRAKNRYGPTKLPINNDATDRTSKEFYDATNQYLLTQALLKAGQTGNPTTTTTIEALYAEAQLLCRNFGNYGANNNPTGLLPPYLFNPHVFGQDFAMKERLQKELVRGLQLTSGGTLVEPAIANTTFPVAYPPGRDVLGRPINEQTDYPKLPSSKLSNKIVSPRHDKMENSSTSNSVKMVIKNGILMPKQKQRRYRTERPFTCEHCSARFTLRSNMERHIKQQHPQHWSQRPRGGHSTRGRPPANPPTLLINTNSSSAQQLSPNYSNILPKSVSTPASSTNYERHHISDHVKYAILAQHLKSNNKVEENDTDEELIIDEGANNVVDFGNNKMAVDDGRPTSLLRGKLEGNDYYKNVNAKKQKQQQQQQQQQQHEQPQELQQPQQPPQPPHNNHQNNHNNIDEPTIPKNEEEDENDEDYDDVADDADHSTDDYSTSKIKSEPRENNDEDSTKDGGSSENPRTTEISNNEQLSNDEGSSSRNDDGAVDLASVSELLDKASQQYQQFQPQYMSDEEGLVASTSDFNNSGSDEKSDSFNSANSTNSNCSKKKKTKKKKKKKKKSAYSMAPNRVICPYCERPFPWTSSLRRHILTHTGQKPYQCMHCSLLFTTKSNCDRHLLRKHKNTSNKIRRMRNSSSPEINEQTTNNNNNNSNNNNNNNNSGNSNNNNNNNSAFAMRNVPERPYKCNLCPSSTFSTLGNLKKHKSSKHTRGYRPSRPDSPFTSEQQNSPTAIGNNKNNDHSDNESQSSGVSDNVEQSENIENRETIDCNNETRDDNLNFEVKVENETPMDEKMETMTTAMTTMTTKVETNVETKDAILNEAILNDENVEGKMETLDDGIMETTDAIETTEPVATSSDATIVKMADNAGATSGEASKSRRPSPRSSPGPTDAPFKCHLCDSGFSERHECLEHIRINHTRSYEILVAKGALDMDIETPEEQQQPPPQQHMSDGEEKRGRFPDYSNRKVVCAFCMRRFWSAEDLRRHMRTHTGERPFSCDICCRRFTLKHSMLRHRKKHESVDSSMYVGTSGDEESVAPQSPAITPRSHHQHQVTSSTTTIINESRIQERISLPVCATVATGDAAPSGHVRYNPYEKLTTLTGKLANAQQNFNANDHADNENDLISNLLGIRDKSIIDKVLQASADDAAKLLGVNRNHD